MIAVMRKRRITMMMDLGSLIRLRKLCRREVWQVSPPSNLFTKKFADERYSHAGLWSGYDTAVLLSIVPALTFYLTNFLSRSFLPTSAQQRPNALQTFATSAGGNALATLLVFPLILSKTRLQWKSPSGKRVYRNLVDVVRKTVRRGGWKGLYQGLNSQLIKGFLSHGVTMVSAALLQECLQGSR